jgi:hypothetical protein
MSLWNQILPLVGVVVGAFMSFSATYFVERTRWRRERAVRWDERRLSAYTDYSYAVKGAVALASRIAAGRGLESGPGPLTSSEENLAKLAEAEASRSVASETLRLFADLDTGTAARAMTRQAWKLEWLAQGIVKGDRSDWRRTYAEYEEARDEYMVCARKNLQIAGPYGARTPRLRSLHPELSADWVQTMSDLKGTAPAPDAQL